MHAHHCRNIALMWPLAPFRVPYTVNRLIAISVAALVLLATPGLPQSSSPGADDTHGMIMTSAGLIAIDTPSGWEQSNGPGLASFVPQNPAANDPDATFILTSSPLENAAEHKALESFITSDIAAFRHRFPRALVHAEAPIALPHYAGSAPVYSFRSGDAAHNAFEQVAYIADYRRIWIVTLSAKSPAALERAMPAFRTLVASYRGSIQFDDTK